MRTLFAFLLVIGLVLLTGCGPIDRPESERQQAEKIQTTESLMKKQPTPKIGFSMDRYLLKERLVRFNNPNKMTYLYCVLPDGSWLQVTIVGKLTSTSKRLTSPEFVDSYAGSYHWGQSPDEMGTWGSSQPDKVGMTTLGSLLEIGGFMAYVYSETPLTFKNLQKPVIEMQVTATPEEQREFLNKMKEMKQEVR